jgi:hypothetical protein
MKDTISAHHWPQAGYCSTGEAHGGAAFYMKDTGLIIKS